MRCEYIIPTTGERCKVSALRGQTLCLFHFPHDVRKEIVKTPMNLDEKISILSEEIRHAKKIKNNFQRSNEIRSLMHMLNFLQGNPDGGEAEETFQEKLDNWEKEKLAK